MVKTRPHTLKIIKEEFNEYELEDGNILRAKEVTISFVLTDEEKIVSKEIKEVGTLANFQLVTAIIPSGEISTDIKQENLEPAQPVTKDKIVKEISFKQLSENLNIYETDELLILARTELTHVYLTSLKDNIGLPRYHVESRAKLQIMQKNQIATGKKIKT